MMNKHKMFKGGLLLFALLGFLFHVLSKEICATTYSGIVNIKTSVLSAQSVDYSSGVYIFTGGEPNQNSDTIPGSLTLLTVAGGNYGVDEITQSGTTYYRYSIVNCSSSRVYLLLKGSSRYSVLGAVTLTTPVPSTTTYTAATFYALGSPPAPTSLTVEAGYETAQAEWQLSSSYDIASVSLQVATDAGFTSLVPASAGTTTTLSSATEYTFGELIDGRVLSPATRYYLRVAASVEGVASSDWTTAVAFTTSSMVATPELTFNLTLESKADNGTGFGINAFSMPFPTPWYVGGTQISTAYDLVQAINNKAGANVVSSFGYWDKTNQQAVGVLIPGNNPSGVATDLRALSLAQGVGYQVYVTQDVADIVIRNTEE